MDKPSQIAFFDELAPRWDETTPFDSGKLRCLVELCDLKEGARILDVACGTGTLEAFLLEKNPSRVLGVDFSPAMIAIARNRCEDPRAELRCCDVMELGGEEFDCAVVLGAFPYFENKGSLIRQMHHLLVPGGRLVIAHSQGRGEVNAHRGNLQPLSMPLPAAQILTKSLAQNFDVDIVIDSPSFYIVSGISSPPTPNS